MFSSSSVNCSECFDFPGGIREVRLAISIKCYGGCRPGDGDVCQRCGFCRRFQIRNDSDKDVGAWGVGRIRDKGPVLRETECVRVQRPCPTPVQLELLGLPWREPKSGTQVG